MPLPQILAVLREKNDGNQKRNDHFEGFLAVYSGLCNGTVQRKCAVNDSEDVQKPHSSVILLCLLILHLLFFQYIIVNV